jgi:hypothetical protein
MENLLNNFNLSNDNNQQEIKIEKENIQAHLFTITNNTNNSDYRIGIKSNKINNKTDYLLSETYQQLLNDETNYYIYINKESILLNNNHMNNNIKLSIIVYLTTSLFINNDKIKEKLSSQILSINTNIKLNSTNQSLVNYNFKQFDYLNSFTNNNNHQSLSYYFKCVYWDFILNNGRGDWNDFGCYYNNITNNCFCNHTTNFAMLIVSKI